jgi:hypothetical protein
MYATEDGGGKFVRIYSGPNGFPSEGDCITWQYETWRVDTLGDRIETDHGGSYVYATIVPDDGDGDEVLETGPIREQE